MRDLKKDLVEIRKFVENNYSGYFISLQLPIPLKSENLDESDRYLKYFLGKFQKHVQYGNENWIKHILDFMGFYENRFGQGTFHLHILGSFINPLTNERIPLEEMCKAMEKANEKLKKRYNVRQGIEYDIQPANNMPKTSNYCTKELIYKGFVDSDRITTAKIMFDPRKKPHKRLTQARLKQKHINNTYPKATTRSTIYERLSSKYQVTVIERSKYHAWSQYKKQEPTEIELQQKAIISRYNRIKIKIITLRTQNAS